MKKPKEKKERSGEEYISVPQAHELAKEYCSEVTRATIYNWCRNYGLGRRIGGAYGKWIVTRELFVKFLKGEFSGEN